MGLAAASEGSTIYDGDRLSTEVTGAMRISIPGLALRLDGQSALVLHRRELRIYAQRGSLDFSYHGASEAIPEGSAFKVLLDPSEKEARLSESDKDGKKVPSKHHPTFVLVAIGIAAGVGIALLMQALESPDRPGP